MNYQVPNLIPYFNKMRFILWLILHSVFCYGLIYFYASHLRPFADIISFRFYNNYSLDTILQDMPYIIMDSLIGILLSFLEMFLLWRYIPSKTKWILCHLIGWFLLITIRLATINFRQAPYFSAFYWTKYLWFNKDYFFIAMIQQYLFLPEISKRYWPITGLCGLILGKFIYDVLWFSIRDSGLVSAGFTRQYYIYYTVIWISYGLSTGIYMKRITAPRNHQ